MKNLLKTSKKSAPILVEKRTLRSAIKNILIVSMVSIVQACRLTDEPFFVTANPISENVKGFRTSLTFPTGASAATCNHRISLTAAGGSSSDYATLLSVSVRTNYSPQPVTVRYGPETLISWFGSNRIYSGKALRSRELLASAAVDRWSQRFEFLLSYPNGEQRPVEYYLGCSLD